MGSKLKK